MENTSGLKFFKGLRILALTALFCTIALTLFIWGESLVSGDKSASQSIGTADKIESAIKTNEPAPPVSAVTGYFVKSVTRDGKPVTDTNSYYTGDVLELGSNVFRQTPTPQNFTSSAVLTSPKIT